ncbi:MAG: DUF362 domain-containing protein [Desulforhopalus sp.]
MRDHSREVVLTRCNTYEGSSIGHKVEMMMKTLLGDPYLHGKIVLLKPNLISVTAPRIGCTRAEFIAAIASWFLSRGARVQIGDSPAFGSVASVCKKQGIVRALRGMNVEMLEFRTAMKVELAGGQTVTVAREPIECDLFVGLPKVKAHKQMFVTLSVKNIFGIVKGANKALLHMVEGRSHDHFAGLIVDLIALLPPQLHLADGIEVMHKSGPLDGQGLNLRCIAGARNPVALDTALLKLLDLDSSLSPLWRVTAARRMKGWNYSDLVFPQLQPEDFPAMGFRAPKQLTPIRFNPLRFFRSIIKRVLTVR